MDSTIPKSGGGNGYSYPQPVKVSRSDTSSGGGEVKVKQQADQQAAAQSMSVAQIHQAQEQAVQELNQAMEAIQGPQKTLQISVHEKTHAIMIKVMNKETGDLIREVPSEKILDVVAKMMELNGILIDKRV